MENKIIKMLLLRPIILLNFVLMFGNSALAFTPSTYENRNDHAANTADSLPLSSSWLQTNWTENNSFFNLCCSKNKVFARTWDSYNGGRMFIINNDGSNWDQIGSADSSIDILSIVQLDTRVLAGTWNGFIESTDEGKTWDAFTCDGIPNDASIWSISKINSTLYTGTTGNIYKSTDNGTTWSQISSGITADARITSIVACGDNLFAASANNGIFISTNNGTNWAASNTNLSNKNISQLLVFENRLFAVTLTGLFISDNNGISWAASQSSLNKVNCLVALKEQLIAGTEDKGAFLSVDKGETWTSFSTGMPAENRIWSLTLSSEGIFAGTNSGIWFTSAPNQVGIEEEISLPISFTLKQNYPNPFNSSTTISFSIPAKLFVSLKIYDRLGRELDEIVSEEMPAGNYNQKWNATDLSGGIYFYRLQAGSYSQTKKLILLP